MAGKLSIQAQQTIAFFDEVKVKVDRLHSLIEQYASAKSGQDQFLQPIGRTAVDVHQMFMSKGYGVMADTANSIAQQAKRGGSQNTKSRNFREMVNSIRTAIDTTIKIVIAEEAHKGEKPPA
ncbi:MAG: hypothetical protein HY560_06355 [Gemmatimonadetes bacterium]|nr:hypothetical protein [Gemmatimonadota bacterium]